MPDLSDHRALVTGASSGIGLEMCKILAGWGCDLTITARRLDRLEALAAELREAHGVDVRCIPLDLSKSDAPGQLFDDTRGAGEHIDILINNAGFGHYTEFAGSEWQRNADMLQLNITSLVELTHRYVAEMLTRDRPAYILNISSIAAFQAVPYFASYAATKSYVRNFSEALAVELKKTNVKVSCLCPGGTYTEFMDVAENKELNGIAKMSMLNADKVALIGLKAMLRGRRSIVSGGLNKLSCWLTRFVPRRTTAFMAAQVLGGKPEKPAELTEGTE
jgi:hypothetical protein